MRKALKRHGSPETITTDRLRSPFSHDRAWMRPEAGDRPLGEQQGRELVPAVPSTRTADAEGQADELLTEDRFARFITTSIRNDIPSIDNLQDSLLGRTGRAAKPHRPTLTRKWRAAGRRRAMIRLTAPPRTPSTSLCYQGVRAKPRKRRVCTAHFVKRVSAGAVLRRQLRRSTRRVSPLIANGSVSLQNRQEQGKKRTEALRSRLKSLENGPTRLQFRCCFQTLRRGRCRFLFRVRPVVTCLNK